ncbi:MAG: Hpt domain-containing protein, partial [Gemmatimonadota bacterium]
MPDTSEADLPTWDRPGLVDRIGGDEDLARELGALFVEGLPELIEAVRLAVEQGDFEAMERAAHTLRGAAANVGAEAFQAAAMTIRRLAEAGRLT